MRLCHCFLDCNTIQNYKSLLYFFAFRSIFNRNVVFHILSSTYKCNLSVRPFVMVAKLAKKYSGEVRMPSFFLGLLFNLFRMKIIERTVLRTFSLGKSPINPHVKIFSSVLTLQKTRVF